MIFCLLWLVLLWLGVDYCSTVGSMKRHRKSAQPDTPAAGPLTVNQLVSHNLMRARRARGLTQAEFAERMHQVTRRPWSNATVSAAERAWTGGRSRKFDANEILGFSLVLGYPVGFFFLAPDDSPGDLEVSMMQPDDLKSQESYPAESLARFSDVLPRIAGIAETQGYGERMKVLFAKYLDAKYEGPSEVVHFSWDGGLPGLDGEIPQATDEEREQLTQSYQDVMDQTAAAAYQRALLVVLARGGLREVIDEARKEFSKGMDAVTKDAAKKIAQAKEEASEQQQDGLGGSADKL